MMTVLVRPLHQVPQRCGAITDCEAARGTAQEACPWRHAANASGVLRAVLERNCATSNQCSGWQMGQGAPYQDVLCPGLVRKGCEAPNSQQERRKRHGNLRDTILSLPRAACRSLSTHCSKTA